MIKTKQFSLLFLSVFIASGVSAERYSVAKDSFGGLFAEAVEVKTEREEVSTNKKNVSDNTIVKNKENEKPKSALIAIPNNEAQVKNNISADKALSPQDSSSSHSTNVSEVAASEPKNVEAVIDVQQHSDTSERKKAPKRKLSVFEKAYYESETKAKAEVLKNLGANKSNQNASEAYDATEVASIKFVDGDVLERTGAREEVEKAPYFITVDADGKPQNTFFDPVLVNEALDKQRNKKIEYTQARVYEKFNQQGDGELDLPEGADPVAVQLLNSGKKEFDLYFEAFTKQCCEQLPNILTSSVELGRPQAFQLTDEDVYYRFSDGDSRFLLVSLPSETNENYPFRIRTFIRTFKKLSVNHGVFFPQIITLNANKVPVRIMTGPLLRYQAETWSTHGYLEGVFQIDRSEEKDERYVLINTTQDVLRQSSVIDSEDPIEINHMSIGSFEIEAILEL